MLQSILNFFKNLFSEIVSKEERKKKEEIIKNQAKKLHERCLKIQNKDNKNKYYNSKSKLTKLEIKKWCDLLIEEGKEEVLLSKHGKKLKGIALNNRIVKYLEVEKRN